MNETLHSLKDIKPPVEVPDHSLWLLLAMVSAVVVAVALLGVWYVRRVPKRRKRGVDPIEIAKSKLKRLDFTDAKGAVYTFDEYFPVLAKESEELKREFEELQKRLERYKYKREVPPLEREDIEAIRAMIEKVAK